MANIAVWGVKLQVKRIETRQNEITEFVMQPVLDFHFLVTALSRLRKCACLISRIYDISDAIEQFDLKLPDLRGARNVLEHVDEYRVGEGRNKNVPDSNFQTLLFNANSIKWAGFTINTDLALSASQELFIAIQELCPTISSAK